jgi:hypothetical protein
LAAPIAELISATSAAAAGINCGCVIKRGIGYSVATNRFYRAIAESALVS